MSAERLSFQFFQAETGTALKLPLAGTAVSAGFPSPADDFVEGRIDLNEFLIRHPTATFYLRVHGHSMAQAGILDGDHVVVDRSERAKAGDIVVAVVDGEFTLKRLERSGEKWILRAEGVGFADIEIAGADQVEVWGVVIGVFRKFGR